MRSRERRVFIIGVLVFTLLLTGAYALLAANLNITGTAAGAGNFKIEFSSFTVSDEAKATALVNEGRTSLDINANLSFPGDTVTINFIIKNTGALAATVQDLIINNNQSSDFSVNITGLSGIEGTTLAVGETTAGSIIIKWNETSTIANPETVNFDVTIDYIQAT